VSLPEESALAARALSASYGSLVVCRDITLDVKPGEVVALIGPNGAGKTSFIGALTGAVASKGEIALGATRLDGRPIHARTRLGLATVPDNRGLFAPLTVAENIRLGAMFVARERRTEVVERAMSYFPFLAERGATLAGSLSGGQQQMLAISRALMAAPDLILLDEPSLGLSPKLTKEIFEIVVRVNRERGTTILLVEQNANMALNVADYGYVLENGRIVMEDTCDRMREKEDIREFYLGMKEAGVRGERRWKKKKMWR